MRSDKRPAPRGPKGKCVANLFTGLLYSSHDHSRFYLHSNGRDGRGGHAKHWLVSSAYLSRLPGASPVRVIYEAFEDAALQYLKAEVGEMIRLVKETTDPAELTAHRTRLKASISELVERVDIRVDPDPPGTARNSHKVRTATARIRFRSGSVRVVRFSEKRGRRRNLANATQPIPGGVIAADSPEVFTELRELDVEMTTQWVMLEALKKVLDRFLGSEGTTDTPGDHRIGG